MTLLPNASAWQPERITVVGLGLLGASLIEAAKKVWPQIVVYGISSEATLTKALELGLVTKGFPYKEIDAACSESDLIILCTPINEIKKTLTHWTLHSLKCKPDCIITDVGSTKAEICALGNKAFAQDIFSAATNALSQKNSSTKKNGCGIFIGSHPMAGSEKTGLTARDTLLFQNASWVICHPEESSTAAPFHPNYIDALARLEYFAQALGARTTIMTAQLHDEVAAHVSHLPQLLATTLASFIAGKTDVVENCLQIAGSGFKDMTRLAGSAFSVWEPILKSNSDNIYNAISGFQKHLSDLESALTKNASCEIFKSGNQLRSQLSQAKKGFTFPLSEVLIEMEDKPGMLVKVFSPLAEMGINVLDVEILKVREGDGGTMLLAFHGNAEAQMAILCLVAQGFKARLK